MELIDTFVEITLKEEQDFLKIKETLTRIGIASKKGNTLFQSCHILHKKGKYYIVHFKQLFALDGKKTDFSEEDRGRLNTIVCLLEDWGLLKIVDKTKTDSPKAGLGAIKIISFKDKENWVLESKYNIGKKF